MEMIEGATGPFVWLAGVEHLARCASDQDFDVMLHVEQPTVLSAEDWAVCHEVDKFLLAHGAFGLHTVAETIFPLDEYLRNGAAGVYGGYHAKLRGIQKGRSDGGWGSYSQRFLRQKGTHGGTFVPLEDLVAKIKAHGKYRASYELGLGRPVEDDHPFEADLPVYDPATDRRRLYGGPCLSHISIKVHDGRVRFNATYRSHFYMRRLLGNLVGLGRLQWFIAEEAGLKVGGLTINSTFARLDAGSGEAPWTKAEAVSLATRCRVLYGLPGASPPPRGRRHATREMAVVPGWQG